MLHNEITNCLGFPLSLIDFKITEDGVRWYKVISFRQLLGLSNTTVSGTSKVPDEHRRLIETLTLSVNGRHVPTRPVYVTETGLWIIVMLNNSPRIKLIRERLAAELFPRISQVR